MSRDYVRELRERARYRYIKEIDRRLGVVDAKIASPIDADAEGCARTCVNYLTGDEPE